MIHIKNAKTDQLITPNHRVLTYNSESKKEVVKLAEDFLTLSSAFHYPTVGNLNSDVNNIDYPEEFYELIIAIQADGHLQTDSKAITFCFTKQRKIDRLLLILNKLNIKNSISVSEREGKKETSIRLLAKQSLVLELLSWFDKDKNLVKSFLELPLDIRISIINSIGIWDGTVRNNKDIVLDSTNFDFVKTIQTLCSTSGFKNSYKEYTKTTTYGIVEVARVYISVNSKNTYKTIRNCASKVSYTGMIGCVSVPSGFVLVRRNNNIFVSGNTLTGQRLGIDRSDAKAINYAIMYGAQAAKIAKMLKISKDEAEKLYQAYWDNTPALKELKVNLEKYWESTNKEYILALDGRRLNSRSQHSLLNLLFQGAGSIAVKYTIMLVSQYLEERGKLGLVDSDTFEESIQKVYQMIVYHRQNCGLVEQSTLNNLFN